MIRRLSIRLAPVYILLVDECKIPELRTCARGKGFTYVVDLGPGVFELPAKELQKIVDEDMKKASRYSTCMTGDVMNRFFANVPSVRAGERYIVTGNMRGGFVKRDMRYGMKLTGYQGSSNRLGIPWAGSDV